MKINQEEEDEVVVDLEKKNEVEKDLTSLSFSASTATNRDIFM